MRVFMEMNVRVSPYSISCQITRMDESLRKGDLNHSFPTSVKLDVRSWTSPELNDHALYVRGSDRSRDLDFFVAYPHRHETYDLVSKMLRALTEYVQSEMNCLAICIRNGDMVTIMDFGGYTPLGSRE